MSSHDIALVRTQNAPFFSVCRFISDYAIGLVNAARVLGGEPAAMRTMRLVEEVAQGAPLDRYMRSALVDLHRLLSLDAVDDFDSVEAAHFAAIDPSSPVVEEICALSDALYGHLVSLANAEDTNPVWRPVLDVAA